MPHQNIITGNSEDEVWKTIADQLNNKKDDLDYTAQFNTTDHCVDLDIDIHPDRGEEGEKPVTSFSVQLPDETSFRFKIQKQGIKHEIGKLFGMQDVIIGNREFDKKFLIQSNDVDKVKKVLSDEKVSSELLKHPVVDFKIRERKIGANKEIVLGLELEGGITETDRLKDAFQAFKAVLNHLG
ncbi:hypothetical protein [Segetibacter aerophilus]|uniref:Uncharacterized protein n=1 Tax=Segetibacter aerophilus TaxID=670293 RepID=A0A512BG18_9BACT|nr:hypothetical protein [Segetibacter aerophilus]GEO10825.1 hypothetical protein SAE01_33210 [Segetibacter aerophilus]